MSSVLVLQHPQLNQLNLKQTLASFPDVSPPTQPIWRIPVAENTVISEAVAHELHTQQVDFAIVPNRPFSHYGLLVSDMDSTLITIECIDEIAARAGLKSQVAAITERAMQGELDFTQSLRERVALLKGIPESELLYVYEHILRLSEGAETLIQQCKQNDVKFLLVSGGFTFFTERLKQKLGLDWAYANELETQNGVLTGRVLGQIVDAQTKAKLLIQHRESLNLSADQVLAVGDGANDIPMLQAAGVGIAYHAKAKTQQYADANICYGGLERLRHWFA